MLTPVPSELITFPDGAGPAVACLVWRFREPLLTASTASFGGGIGIRDWVVNVQVPIGYARRDIETHLAEVADELELAGSGVGMLTAVDVDRVAACAGEAGVRVEATVGLSSPVWAAEIGASARAVWSPGTVNIIAFVPVRHVDAAMANLLCTVTEAKAQALADGGIQGTGTVSDAVTVVCPASGPPEPFGGPRSAYGAPIARAVYTAMREGMRARS